MMPHVAMCAVVFNVASAGMHMSDAARAWSVSLYPNPGDDGITTTALLSPSRPFACRVGLDILAALKSDT